MQFPYNEVVDNWWKAHFSPLHNMWNSRGTKWDNWKNMCFISTQKSDPKSTCDQRLSPPDFLVEPMSCATRVERQRLGEKRKIGERRERDRERWGEKRKREEWKVES